MPEKSLPASKRKRQPDYNLVLQALAPEDRLGAGTVVYAGYVPSNVADLVHCLNIGLDHLLKRQGVGDSAKIRKTKREIERLIRLCDRAIRLLTEGQR